MVVSNPISHTSRVIVAGLAGLLTIAGSIGLAHAQNANAPTLTGVNPVIAQQVADFPAGPLMFVVEERTIADATQALPGNGTGFLIGTAGTLLLEASSGPSVLLETGEAAPIQPGKEYLAQPIDAASVLEVGLRAEAPMDAVFAGNPISDLAGARELELSRIELESEQGKRIESEAGAGLLVVLEGSVLVEAPNGSTARLAAGEAIELDDSTPITGVDNTSVVIAVTVGDAFDRSADGLGIVPGSNRGSAGSGSPGSSLPSVDVDSDGDGLSDADEARYGSDPNDADSDQDGLSDGDEVHLYGSSPTSIDTDGDMLGDYIEVMQHGTDPANPDSDGDGLSDHDEFTYEGADPLKYDSDGDGLNDYEEVLYGATSETPDYDGDGLTDFEEAKIYGSYPYSPDSDGDMLSDYQEARDYGTNPLAKDSDGDGLWDYNEVTDFMTDPKNADTDGDGHSDGFEINDGYDPLDPGDPAPIQS